MTTKLDQDVVKSLNKLMQLHYDAEKTFLAADRNLKPDGYLDVHLKDQAQMHGRYLQELRHELEERFIKPEEVADFFEDAFDNMSMKLTAITTSDDERILLKKCQQSQMNMLDDYDRALNIETLPTELCENLEQQFMHVKQSIAGTERMIEALTEE